MIRDLAYMEVLKTGPGTSIQDLGRKGFAELGVPCSGALDKRSFLWVNHLLQNNPSNAGLEILQPGLTVRFEAPSLICLGGATASIKINGAMIPEHGLMEIQSNDVLEIGSFDLGSALYLGIKFGFQSDKVMNSRSWFPGITHTGFAKQGEKISYYTNQGLPSYTASKVKWDASWMESKIIEAYPGPEWELLNQHSKELLASSEFTISDLKNRMAIQLTELLANTIPEMATAAVFPGTVQLTSSGKMIVLLKDAQVTGGYPRILQISELSLDILAQKQPKTKIKFRIQKIL